MHKAIAGALIAVTAFAGSANADEFYKGKRLTVMINYGVGGPSDVEGRVFARHIGRLIDGHPNIVVQNIEGAGGLTGATWLGEVAPKDGSVLGHLTGVAWRYANNPERFRVNLLSYQFLGYQGATNIYYVRTDVEPGIATPADLLKAKGLVSGGLAPDSSKDLSIRLGLQMLGIEHKHVTSYRSSAHARLAMQQKEINFFAESPPSYRSLVHPDLVKRGVVLPVWHDPAGEDLAVSPEVADLGIPPFHEYFRSVKGRMPSGELWDAYNTVRLVGGGMLRVLALPPGSPAAATEALNVALARMDKDQTYIDDVTKVLGFVPQYVIGPNINQQVRRALTVSPQMRAFMADYINKASK